jgi:RNA polymerase sigma-70 factor (ECF subfamily)
MVEEVERPLRLALVAVYGQEHGRDATAEALLYAWQNRSRIRDMENPAGYLYRVGRSKGRRRRLRPPMLPLATDRLPEVEPGLPAALAGLSEKQRIAVVLVHAYGYERREVAEMVSITTSTLDTHLTRGLERLREALGVGTNA